MLLKRATHRLLLLGLLLPFVTGCAAFRPVNGLPARYVPDEFRGVSRSGKRTIDLSLLRQTPPVAHRVDSGDLLSIYIEGVLGRSAEPLPVYLSPTGDVPPSVGYPIPVREDGTVSLPYVGALAVRGLTLVEVEDRIRRAYTVDQQVLNPGRDRMIVALQQPRQYRITVIRQEANADAGSSSTGTLNLGVLKRGTGKVVTLPVYRNDVLNALAETGGLPGLDAENAIYVIRNSDRATLALPAAADLGRHERPLSIGNAANRSTMSSATIRAQSPGWSKPTGGLPGVDYRHNGFQAALPLSPPLTPQPDFMISGRGTESPTPEAPAVRAWEPLPAYSTAPNGPLLSDFQPSLPATVQPSWSQPTITIPSDELGVAADHRHIIRIPVRLGPGEYADIRESDIILYDGDIVFIESRETEVFYTGGLLGGGQYSLPRDYDLDVLGAIAIAQGRSSGGGSTSATSSVGGPSALNNDVSISASHVIILRQLPDGSQLPILVDLYAALRDPAERVIIQPGDYVMLQYTCPEAVLAFIERHLLAGALFGLAAAQFQTGGGN